MSSGGQTLAAPDYILDPLGQTWRPSWSSWRPYWAVLAVRCQLIAPWAKLWTGASPGRLTVVLATVLTQAGHFSRGSRPD
eukprot:290024-Pyramimonas_sp.AAC.1